MEVPFLLFMFDVLETFHYTHLTVASLDCLRQVWLVSIIRTEHKYQEVDEMAKMVDNADMFRAQRNVYISGPVSYTHLTLPTILLV